MKVTELINLISSLNNKWGKKKPKQWSEKYNSIWLTHQQRKRANPKHFAPIYHGGNGSCASFVRCRGTMSQLCTERFSFRGFHWRRSCLGAPWRQDTLKLSAARIIDPQLNGAFMSHRFSIRISSITVNVYSGPLALIICTERISSAQQPRKFYCDMRLLLSRVRYRGLCVVYSGLWLKLNFSVDVNSREARM